MRKKIAILALFVAGGFFTTNRAQTCTMDPAGTYHCEPIMNGGNLVGYKCVEGNVNNRCVKPPKFED